MKTRLRRALISAAGRVFSCLSPNETTVIHTTKDHEKMLNSDDEEESDDLDPNTVEDLNDLADYGVDSSLIGDQEWEDTLAFMNVRKKHPYPHILKVINYTPALLKEQEEWLAENCRKPWERIGWYGHCSYTVAIGFMSHVDAVLYRLRFSQ